MLNILNIMLIVELLAAASWGGPHVNGVAARSTARSGKILGGNQVQIEQYPWLVSLGKYKQISRNGRRQIQKQIHCDGSIISEIWVLTAGHCVVDPSYHLKENLTHVFAGSSITFGRDATIHPIADKKVYDKYHFSTFANVSRYDIALIRVSRPFVYSSRIQPVVLYEGSPRSLVGKYVDISGFGLQGKISSKHLLAAQIKIVDQNICNQVLHYKYRSEVNGGQICAVDESHRVGVCSGDSGGPVTIGNVLFGVISFSGKPCGTGYAVFSDVAYYRNWILRQIVLTNN